MKRSRSSFLTISVPVVLFIIIVTIVAVGLLRSDPAARLAAPAVQENPTEPWAPTPVPTVILSPIPPATPPAPGAEETEEALQMASATPMPAMTPEPDGPCHITGEGERPVYDTDFAAKHATIIMIATVKEIMPARWTTPDGTRPDKPCGPVMNPYSIFTPMVFDAKQILKSQVPALPLFVFGRGGVVGQDSLEVRPDPDDFQTGERILVFLSGPYTIIPNSSPFWATEGHYHLNDNGEAININRSVPLAQLINEIQQAVDQ